MALGFPGFTDPNEDPLEAAEDIAEFRAWLRGEWHAADDEDGLEDLQRFYAYLNRVFAQVMPAFPFASSASETDAWIVAGPAIAAPVQHDIASTPQTGDISERPAIPPHQQSDNPTPTDGWVTHIPLIVFPLFLASDDDQAQPVEDQCDASDDLNSDLLVRDAAFVKLAELEVQLRRFLQGFEQSVENMLALFEPGSLTPWIASAMLSATALELARRQLRNALIPLDGTAHGSPCSISYRGESEHS